MWVQTVVNLPANTSVPLLPANARRLRLRWMVTGTSAITVSPATPVLLGEGLVYGAASAVGQEGGADDFQQDCAQDGFYGIAAAPTKLVIWEFVENYGVPAAGNSNLNAAP